MLANFGDLIVCLCGGELAPRDDDAAAVCVTCKNSFPYRDGILITRDEDKDRETDQRILEEQRVRDKQAKLYDTIVGVNVPSWSEGRLMRQHLRQVSSRVGLDAGCGTGRLTRPMAQVCQRVIAADRSVMSLRLCHEKLRKRNVHTRVLLVQADILSIPIRPGVADLLLTAQVLQHLPTPEARAEAVENLARALTPDARLIASLYEWGKPWRRQKELTHAGGISAYRFTKDEVAALFGTHFDVDSLQSCLGDLVVATGSRR